MKMHERSFQTSRRQIDFASNVFLGSPWTSGIQLHPAKFNLNMSKN